MMIKNKLFLILFNSKESKWDSWRRFASKNNYFFSILSEPTERPILRGQLKNKPISIEAVYSGKPNMDMNIKIIAPIHNPKEDYLLLQDKKRHQPKSEIFKKPLPDIFNSKELEERFFIKSNSERLTLQILKCQALVNELLSKKNYSIEISNYELILTIYKELEINAEFIELLKLFYSFLLKLEEISLEEVINRKI